MLSEAFETFLWLQPYTLPPFLILLAVAWIYKEVTMGVCNSPKRLDGKVAIVTGGSRGIGYETALDLAKRGAEVIIAGIDFAECKDAHERIIKLTGNTSVHALKLDLSSQKDIKHFVSEIKGKFEKVHFLVNNAGILMKGGKRVNSVDGYEMVMATNYFGTFTLTMMLLDKIKSSGEPGDPSRVVHVSSYLQFECKKITSDFDLDSFPSEKPTMQYGYSKLLVNLNCRALSMELRDTNTQIVCLHPGIISSGIENQLANFMERWNTKIFATFLGKSIEMGAQTSIYCVVTNENINGKYLADCREERLLVNRCFYDEELAKQMFVKTKIFLGLEKRD